LAIKRRFGVAQHATVAITSAFGTLALIAVAAMSAGVSALDRAQQQLAQSNYAWAVLEARDGIVFVTGAAADVESRRYAVIEAERLLREVSEPETADLLVVDATSLADQPIAPGAPIRDLGAAPDAAACQTALAEAAAGGFEFSQGETVLDERHQPMLNALAAGVRACRDHVVAFAAHTDAVGSAAANQILSEGRAAHIVERLATKGAPLSAMRAIGYGESRLLARSGTSAAHARNRRVEITVSAQSS
jgi:outer membrane protein OmpA-like peptidoglycan-associated protein